MRPLSLAEKLDPATTAFLVIDVQNDYIHPDGYHGRQGRDLSAVSGMVPRLVDLLEVARSSGVTVIFLRNWHRPETDSPAWRDRLLKAGRAPDDRAARAGTWGAEFYRVAPTPGEEVVNKFRYDGFPGTNLEYLLRAKGISTVVCAGTATHICVESTARAAHMRDFHLVMAEDCCAAPDIADHRAAMRTLGGNFGDLVRASEIAAIWRGATAPSSSGGLGQAQVSLTAR